MKKGIIYVRVSSADQTHGTSLVSQERACIEYAEKNGIEVVQIFIEKGESATAADRTEFLKALDFCRKKKGEIQCFIVWKIDRFARNTTDHFAVRAKLTQYGITLQSVTEPITQDHTGKLMETFLAGYAEFENDVRKQRCTAGMQARLRAGIWCWSPPIGYVNSKKTKERRKMNPDIPDEERFYLIQKGLRLYMKGNHSITALAMESINWGLRTRTAKPIRKQLWEVILSDKFYAGILVDPWSGEEFAGVHKAMITREEFDLIQRIKKGKSNHATARRLLLNPDFPLRRFVLCECGRPHSASWSTGRNKRYAFYHCKNRQCPHFGKCIAKNVIERKFCELLLKITPSVKFLELFKKIVVEIHLEMRTVEKNEKAHNEREMAKLQMRRKELLEMRINKEISQAEYKEVKDALDERINRLATIENRAQGDYDIEVIIGRIIDIMANIAVTWERSSSLQKMKIQKAVLPKGVTFTKNYEQCGTTILSPIFKLNQAFLDDPSGLVAEARQNWNQITQDIENISSLTRETDNTKEPGMSILPVATDPYSDGRDDFIVRTK